MSIMKVIIERWRRMAGIIERAGVILATGQEDMLIGIIERPQTDGRVFLATLGR
jgi:hypothetical protein